MVAIEIGPTNELFADIKRRGIHLRVLTEITAGNISSCKKLNELIDDLRHLDGINGTFYTSETEYLVPEIFHEEGKAASQMTYTNVSELVEQQQHIFDTLWKKSMPADEKIKEIEEGIQTVPQLYRHMYLYLTICGDNLNCMRILKINYGPPRTSCQP
jgi:hypothetical protein